MKRAITGDILIFAEDFLNRLRKILNHLAPGAIRETDRDGLLYFNFKKANACICVYNVHYEGVQLIFKQSASKKRFQRCQEYSLASPPDWKTILNVIMDILNKLKEILDS